MSVQLAYCSLQTCPKKGERVNGRSNGKKIRATGRDRKKKQERKTNKGMSQISAKDKDRQEKRGKRGEEEK